MPEKPHRTALVTGGGSFLGREITARFLANGLHCAVHYDSRRPAFRDHAPGTFGLEPYLFQADFMKKGEIERLWQEVTAKLGRIDVLVNNAALYKPGRFSDGTLEEYAGLFAVNSFAPLTLIGLMGRQDVPCTVVNVLDCRIDDYIPGYAWYGLSKELLRTATGYAAMEYGPRMRVNAVAPGKIADDGAAWSISAEAVADAVWYLCTAESVNGEVLFVDGGRHLFKGHNSLEGYRNHV